VSLKAFHVVFVTLATLLVVGVGLWAALRQYHQGHETAMLAVCVGCTAMVVGLIVYGVWFLRKTRDFGFL
jgi:hypothetical protein